MIKHIQAATDQKISFPIALVVSLFNRDVTYALQQGALEHLAQKGFKPEDIVLVEVPGAVEIPLLAQQLALQEKWGAIIALGAVIRGETSHYDVVCQMVSQGCLRVSLDYNIPVIMGVLTTDDEAQAWARLGGEQGHKGRDAVDSAIAMYDVLKQCKVER